MRTVDKNETKVGILTLATSTRQFIREPALLLWREKTFETEMREREEP